MKRLSLVSTLVLSAAFWSQAATAQTLKTVTDRGALSCGVSQGLPGFSLPDDKGNWTGLDVDICRAIAAAIFISLLEAYASIWVSPAQAVIVSFVVLILTLLFRPTGLFVPTPK